MDKVLGIVRHIVGGVGAGLVGFGLSDTATVNEVIAQIDVVVGGVMFIAGVGASIYNKIQNRLG